MLTIEPGEGPEYCPSCERVFNLTEMREMWERAVHWTGVSETYGLGSVDWATRFND